jgi:hypothetical protein
MLRICQEHSQASCDVHCPLAAAWPDNGGSGRPALAACHTGNHYVPGSAVRRALTARGLPALALYHIFIMKSLSPRAASVCAEQPLPVPRAFSRFDMFCAPETSGWATPRKAVWQGLRLACCALAVPVQHLALDEIPARAGEGELHKLTLKLTLVRNLAVMQGKGAAGGPLDYLCAPPACTACLVWGRAAQPCALAVIASRGGTCAAGNSARLSPAVPQAMC